MMFDPQITDNHEEKVKPTKNAEPIIQKAQVG
jgi:hypothetical protein